MIDQITGNSYNPLPASLPSSADPIFIGLNARQALSDVLGLGYTIAGVPVEADGNFPGTAMGHIEEAGLGRTWAGSPAAVGSRKILEPSEPSGYVCVPGFHAELMTGWSQQWDHMPVSAITIGILQDLGWDVNSCHAEQYQVERCN